MIELKTYAGSNVTPQNDAIMNDTNTLNNGIYYGCNVTIKDATTLHINAGQGIVYGRLFEVLDSDIPVSLSPSGTLLGQLYVHIDLSNIAAPIQILVDTGETLADLEDDPQLNIDSGITDMQLATFTVSTVGMSDLVETFKEVEPIRAVLGDADISAIGDGTVKGSIRAINTHLNDIGNADQLAYVNTTDTTRVLLPHNLSDYRSIVITCEYGGIGATQNYPIEVFTRDTATRWTVSNFGTSATYDSNRAITASYVDDTHIDVTLYSLGLNCYVYGVK